MRALPKEPPDSLARPHDGVTLEEVIGDLQSTWGVPQYPQEYRLTIKVGDEGQAKEASVSLDAQERDRAEGGRAPSGNGAPGREKAAGAPLMRETAPPLKGPRRRRRGRRRRGSSSG